MRPWTVWEVPIGAPDRKPRLSLARKRLPPGRPQRDSAPVRDPELDPYRSIGLLLDAELGVATSAWLIAPDWIATAGHCLSRVRESPRPRQLYFSPGPRRQGPGGWIRLVQAATLVGLLEDADYRYDLGLARLERPLDRPFYRPDPALKPRHGHLLLTGFPSRPVPDHPYDGRTVWWERCRDWRWGRNGGWASTHFTEGCSGGPWFQRQGRRLIPVGLTSRGGDGFVTSPLFGRGLAGLLRWMDRQG